MDYSNIKTESYENKHLSLEERMIIQFVIKVEIKLYEIAKELKRLINIILN